MIASANSNNGDVARSSNRAVRVLVADDDPDILELVCLRVRQAGYEVIEACDGAEAYAGAIELLPDLCILDVRMPRMDGYEVVRALRAHPGTASMPLMLLTAHASETDRTTGLESGADAFMRKPFSADELKSRVAELLGGR